MSFLFSGIFWGVVVVILGVIIIINAVFGTRIPIFPLLFGLFLIWLGVRVMTGPSHRKTPQQAIFEEKKIETDSTSGKYDVVFGKGMIDLTGYKLKEGITRIEINTIFGSSEIKIDSAMPIKIRASSAFGSARMPDKSMVGFGENTYRSEVLKQTDTKNYLLIELHVVFGSAEVYAK
jgi:predicted membrane protein